MTPQEVIDQAELTLETIEAKNEAEGGCVECDRKHKEFLRAVIDCAKKAMIVDKARDMLDDVDTDAFLRSLMK